jgi:hypothetical protein
MVVKIARFLEERNVFSFESGFMSLYTKRRILISYKYTFRAGTFDVILEHKIFESPCYFVRHISNKIISFANP